MLASLADNAIFSYVGLAVCGVVAFRIALVLLGAVYTWGLRPRKNFVKSFGQWAVVTGATDGIGKAYAIELARAGMNVVLISRSADKLKEAAAEVEAANKKTKVSTKIVVADFSEGNKIYPAIEQALAGLEIGVLVNNVGISYEYPEYFLQISDQTVDQLVQLNVVAVTKMTKMVLPGMVERKRGAVVNISSASGSFPCPLLAVYSASKAFMDFFSLSLSQEYAASGVHVQSVVPFYVASKMSKMRAGYATPTPGTYARAALNKLGYERRTNGYWVHALMATVIALLPSAVVDHYSWGMHASVRARALKKKEKASKSS